MNDLNVKMGLPFPKLAKVKEDETVLFSWIVYKSKASRNAVIKVMKDPRLADLCNANNMPFEMKHMSYGGFKVMVEA